MSGQGTGPYGQWESPITSDTVISTNIVFDDVLVDPITHVIYHIEERPDDNGRCVIVDTVQNKDVLPSPYSARTYVQEYGGAAAIVFGGIIYFSNDSGDPNNPDNAMYSITTEDGATPVRVTTANPNWRYANFAVHPKETHLLVSILEDHTIDTPQGVVNTLCVVDTKIGSACNLISGADFYAAPVFNPSGTKLAWQEWYLPDMPFEGALICVGDVIIEDGIIQSISNRVQVAGKQIDISATYPSWITDTTLIYTSDESAGFQNPFIYNTETNKSIAALKTPRQQDFAEPAWTLGLYPYAILDGGRFGAFTAFQDGRNILYLLDLTQPSDPIQVDDFDFTVAQHLRTASSSRFVFTGSKSSAPGGVVLCSISGSPASYTVEFTILKPSADPSHLDEFISEPEPLTLRTDDNPLYVVFYAPKNPNYSGSSIPGEKPPCIVHVHGGPTAMEPQALNWQKMYFTSRGFAWLDVNYRGSSGYGRVYIERLAGQWGVYDIEDCKEAPSILASPPHSYIDEKRVAIRGGSAGGYTTLASLTLATDTKYFKAATSAYGGISDLTLLAQITEKFELQYMYKLLGGSPEQIPQVYNARSPIDNIANPDTGVPNISVPLLMLQGENDGVVPPAQAHEFLDKIARLAPDEKVEAKFYAGEGHHWHLASTIKDALEREHRWYVDNLL